jgi:hypothetical protein
MTIKCFRVDFGSPFFLRGWGEKSTEGGRGNLIGKVVLHKGFRENLVSNVYYIGDKTDHILTKEEWSFKPRTSQNIYKLIGKNHSTLPINFGSSRVEIGIKWIKSFFNLFH